MAADNTRAAVSLAKAVASLWASFCGLDATGATQAAIVSLVGHCLVIIAVPLRRGPGVGIHSTSVVATNGEVSERSLAVPRGAIEIVREAEEPCIQVAQPSQQSRYHFQT